MKKITTLSILIAACAWGCSKEDKADSKKSAVVEDKKAAEIPAEPVEPVTEPTKAAEEKAEDELPVASDFEDEVEQAIVEDGYKKELETLEQEISTEEKGS